MRFTQVCLTIAIFFIALFIIFQIKDDVQNNNQASPLLSKNGNYVLSVPIISEKRGGFNSWWKVTISDKNGNLLYSDNEGFPARFNVYWTWDENDRVWLYNSDDSVIYYWEMKNNNWVKNRYEYKNNAIKIPSDLLPEYAK